MTQVMRCVVIRDTISCCHRRSHQAEAKLIESVIRTRCPGDALMDRKSVMALADMCMHNCSWPYPLPSPALGSSQPFKTREWGIKCFKLFMHFRRWKCKLCLGHKIDPRRSCESYEVVGWVTFWAPRRENECGRWREPSDLSTAPNRCYF